MFMSVPKFSKQMNHILLPVGPSVETQCLHWQVNGATSICVTVQYNTVYIDTYLTSIQFQICYCDSWSLISFLPAAVRRTVFSASRDWDGAVIASLTSSKSLYRHLYIRILQGAWCYQSIKRYRRWLESFCVQSWVIWTCKSLSSQWQ